MAATREATRRPVNTAEASAAPYDKLSPGPGRPATLVAKNQRARIFSAMTELVACKGYKAVNVRDLVRLAGVSTRTFYERFASKEDCFLQTYSAIVQGATQRIFSPQAYVGDPLERQRQIVPALVRELESSPKAARLALIDALDGDSPALEHAQRVERSFEAMLAEALASSPGGIRVPPLVIEAMVAGALGTVRLRLLSGDPAALNDLQSDLLDWASCFASDISAALADLDRQTVWRNTALQPLPIPQSPRDGTYVGDRALILTAVSELAISQRYDRLTAQRIRVSAGVSRKKFDAHFSSVEDCLLAALEWRSREVCAQIARARAAARTQSGGVYRAIIALADHMSNDRLLNKICLHVNFASGAGIEQARQRLVSTLMEQLVVENASRTASFCNVTKSALWALLCRHAFQDSGLRGEVAATLSYVVLAPMVGGDAALSAIRDEQA
jgi:AcrR family transcriptional regulator